ncbi:hypothetical protein BJ508DRAFT_328305 [Ascobolus immersus RN42]|uniref:Uncharacterized protein n=1 Tax=Ascobolus immersus RN42 TaxID=1160509 RepID=A0A3N4ICG9_ASCIM|nr:hypothetical protein BJ508DRAFT_328305 [Ascobolus immersus RN42]
MSGGNRGSRSKENRQIRNKQRVLKTSDRRRGGFAPAPISAPADGSAVNRGAALQENLSRQLATVQKIAELNQKLKVLTKEEERITNQQNKLIDLVEDNNARQPQEAVALGRAYSFALLLDWSDRKGSGSKVPPPGYFNLLKEAEKAYGRLGNGQGSYLHSLPQGDLERDFRHWRTRNDYNQKKPFEAYEPIATSTPPSSPSPKLSDPSPKPLTPVSGAVVPFESQTPEDTFFSFAKSPLLLEGPPESPQGFVSIIKKETIRAAAILIAKDINNVYGLFNKSTRILDTIENKRSRTKYLSDAKRKNITGEQLLEASNVIARFV